MDVVDFNEEFSSLYVAGRDKMPSHRYENLDKVLKTISYSGSVYVMGEKSKVKMYEDVRDAVRYAVSISVANARAFENTVNSILDEKGYETDCVVKTVIEKDFEVGKTLKEFYVKGSQDEDLEK